ncbi:WxL domain-containing protein [Carnobacterium divergens]|uniref:WxL domain-containing protein n=1 Tax=Carnobacterium divergens TaxID=2748 RepID=A0AAW8RDC3_CARDV|nr:WxL domain-containing protein [Carnobacterium divergens]MDT1958937.1 WxL domain-containing protein [Carnobacterium divergens]MDT1974905.1 WxL domain-containing protein [Carnobacterium divergens]MDT2012957.1 WxL domain-containing protein [Carnobacterium divergens]
MKLSKLVTSSALVLLTLGATTSTALAADGGVYESNGVVEFIPNDGITPPVDPENPDPTNPVDPIDPTDPEGPNPGTNGPLSIDYASSLSFGKNKITNKDEIYYANAQELKDGSFKPNYVQISDNRGTNAGWSLTVKQEGQFQNKETQNKVLTGTVLKLAESTAVSNAEGVTAPTTSDIILDPSGATSPVMSAQTGNGAGTWVDRFGTVEAMEIDGETIQKNKAITLEVPGSTPKDAVKYSTKLTWTLTDTPGNE